MTLEERLNEMLNEQKERIQELEEKNEQLKREFDLGRLSWQLISGFQNDEFYQQIPYPRLEMRLQKQGNDWYSVEWVYGLVYKHYVDLDNNTLIFIPMSQTTSRGGNCTFESWLINGKLSTPFRDIIHIMYESNLFNLPIYIVCREKEIYQKIDITKDFSDALKKAKQ